MLTLQILDGGETRFHTLEARPITIGGSPDADLRLAEEGVAPLHARIEPHEVDGELRYKIVDLDSEQGTRVNGEPVAQWLLSLGDRVELGRAVLVLGRRVARRATPRDVLETPTPIAVERGPRPRRRPGGDSQRALWLAIGGVAAACVLVWAAVAAGSESLPVGWSEVRRLRDAGSFAEARALLDRFRHEWADSGSDRALLDSEMSRIAALQGAVEAGRDRIVREAGLKSRLEQIEELRAIEAQDPDAPAGRAARLLLSELADLRLRAEPTRVEVASSAEPAEPVDPPAVTTPDPDAASGEPAAMPTAESSAEFGPAFVAERVDEVRRVRDRGEYSLALEMVREALASVVADHAEPLRAMADSLRATILEKMERVVADANAVADQGTVADFEQALQILDEQQRRFPADGDFAILARARDELLARRGTFRPAASTAPALDLADVRDALAGARRAERDGDYSGASATFARVAEAAEAEDPLFARELRGLAEDSALVAEAVAFLGGCLPGEPIEVDLRDGRRVRLVAVSGDRALAETAAGRGPVAWADVVPADLRAYARRMKAVPRVVIGVEVLAYRNGDRTGAEDRLVELARSDTRLLPVLSGVVARGRGELVDGRGYQVVDGELVAVRLIEADRLARKLAVDLRRAIGGNAAARERKLDELLAAGPDVLDALVIALRREGERVAERISGHAFRKQFDRLTAVRLELDRARANAKELIFDEVRYFYPYKPPAVSGERASEYWKVQGEVDERVAAVREIWERGGASLRVPGALREEIERLRWVEEALRGFGETPAAERDRVAWVDTLPADEPLTLRSFCTTVEERRERDLHLRVRAFNERQFATLSRAEVELVKVTNDYREMFGHRPLAVNAKLVEATRGHAEEMIRLGYFSHFSPVEGRRTPYERMRLAGYAAGVSENLANHPSAMSAHIGWIHSSGHHRNLLMATHTEFAVGNSGNYWVQNFGRGDDYRTDDAFR